jgi:hypothetical protein
MDYELCQCFSGIPAVYLETSLFENLFVSHWQAHISQPSSHLITLHRLIKSLFILDSAASSIRRC